MKKNLLGISLIYLFSTLTGCGSPATTEMIAPTVIESPASTVNQADQQASSNSFFQPERRIADIVSGIMNANDHNRNNTIDYRTTATSYNDYYRSNENNTYSDETEPSVNGSIPRNYINIYTRSKLFIASDKNNDGIATTEELINFITEKYDTNNDDILSSRGIAFWQAKDEYNLFNGDYKETFFRRMYV